MKNKHITIILILTIFLITLTITIFNLNKIYINKIKPINIKINTYSKLKEKNKELNEKILKENNKYNENKKTLAKYLIEREKLEKIIYEKNDKADGKIIYLTFDDGPSIYTDEILNILDKYDVKATFFVTCSDNLDYYAKKYIEKGHTLGLHSCTHKYGQIYSSEENYFNDLNMLSNIVENSTGYKSKYVRFPGGSSNTVSRFNRGIMTTLSKKLYEYGYKYYDWNIDSNDAGGADFNQIYSNVIGALEYSNRDTSIVLMHDTKVETKNALEKIIIDALNMGYTFGNINDYTKEIHHYINN